MKYLLILGIMLSFFSCAKKYTNQECVDKVEKDLGITTEKVDDVCSFLCEAAYNNPDEVIKTLRNLK